MTIKELKEKIQNLPDDTIVKMEGRWGETFDVHHIELENFSPSEIKVLYLS